MNTLHERHIGSVTHDRGEARAPSISQDRTPIRTDVRLNGPASIVSMLALAGCTVLVATLWSSGGNSGVRAGGQEFVLAGGDGARLSRMSTCEITVYYPDGWIERIVGGNYELIDQQKRRVVRRAATRDDLDRMSKPC